MNSMLRNYFTLGAIINPFPNQIANGQPEDANPVMTLFNWIMSQVNANAAPISTVSTSIPVYVATVGGTANAITLTPAPAITSYAAGQRFSFQCGTTNTGAVTVAVSGLGAQSLFTKNGFQLTGEELRAGGMYEIEYSPGGAFNLLNSDLGTVNGTPFTPVLTFGGLSVGVAYNTQSGYYNKIGNRVDFWVQLILTSKGSSVGQAAIGGLPYNINNTVLTSNHPIGIATLNQITFADKYVVAAAVAGTKTFSLASTPGGGGGGPNFLADTAFANTSAIFATGFYPV
jgi:hypothetical protein